MQYYPFFWRSQIFRVFWCSMYDETFVVIQYIFSCELTDYSVTSVTDCGFCASPNIVLSYVCIEDVLYDAIFVCTIFYYTKDVCLVRAILSIFWRSQIFTVFWCSTCYKTFVINKVVNIEFFTLYTLTGTVLFHVQYLYVFAYCISSPLLYWYDCIIRVSVYNRCCSNMTKK